MPNPKSGVPPQLFPKSLLSSIQDLVYDLVYHGTVGRSFLTATWREYTIHARFRGVPGTSLPDSHLSGEESSLFSITAEDPVPGNILLA
jgi:hypothetical protein